MSDGFISFDAMRGQVSKLLTASRKSLVELERVYLVRDLLGRVRISVSEVIGADESSRAALQLFARSLQTALGAHGYPAEVGVLFVDTAMLDRLDTGAIRIDRNVYWVDRLVTGGDWWTVGDSRPERNVTRYTLYSVKGGVGRSTTAAVLSWHLARNGERVLVVDLDLESPGLSSAMVDRDSLPRFGVTDWFVEDLVGQGEHVIDGMAVYPSWGMDFDGEVNVVPSHGKEPGEYLAKLGRVYLDKDIPWTARLERMLSQLEERYDPSIVLLESRSGLHDIAAATVTDLDAQVLLFAINSDSHWTDYDILFRHWHSHGLAWSIRERLSIVSGLTPELETEPYLERFRERAWILFMDHLYDDVDPASHSAGEYSFDIFDQGAPHDPIPIHWTRGLAADASLHDLEQTTVDQAYTQFLARFDELAKKDREAGFR